jgi:hypothetical protein
MKSMSLVFLAAFAAAMYVAGARSSSTGQTALVASSVSTESWRRACSYFGGQGIVVIEIDAAETCPAALPAVAERATRQASLAR